MGIERFTEPQQKIGVRFEFYFELMLGTGGCRKRTFKSTIFKYWVDIDKDLNNESVSRYKSLSWTSIWISSYTFFKTVEMKKKFCGAGRRGAGSLSKRNVAQVD